MPQSRGRLSRLALPLKALADRFAFAALIAAGLAGIDEKLELQKPFVGDAYQAMPLHGYTRLFERMLALPEGLLQLPPYRNQSLSLNGIELVRLSPNERVIITST